MLNYTALNFLLLLTESIQIYVYTPYPSPKKIPDVFILQDFSFGLKKKKLPKMSGNIVICLFQPLNIAGHYTDDSVTIVEKSFGLVMHQALSSMGKERTCWLTAVKNKKFQKSTVIVNHIRQHNFATSILPVEMDSKTSTLLTKYIVSIHNWRQKFYWWSAANFGAKSISQDGGRFTDESELFAV